MTGSPTLSTETSISRRVPAVAVLGITPLRSAIGGPAVAKSGVMTPRKRPRITVPTTIRKTVLGLSLNQRLTAASTRASDRGRRLVLAEHAPQRATDLTERGLGTHRVEDAWHERLVGRRRLFDGSDRALHGCAITPGAVPREPLRLRGHRSLVGPEEQRRAAFLGLGVPVDTDDDLVADRDRALGPVRLVLDVLLHPAGFDAGHRAAKGVDLVKELQGFTFELVGQPLDVIRPTQRVDGVRHPRLLGDDLLGAHRDALRFLGGNGERLVVARERK